MIEKKYKLFRLIDKLFKTQFLLVFWQKRPTTSTEWTITTSLHIGMLKERIFNWVYTNNMWITFTCKILNSVDQFAELDLVLINLFPIKEQHQLGVGGLNALWTALRP